MRTTAIFLLLVLLAACTIKTNRGTHELNMKCSNTDSLYLKSIEITDQFTKINFKSSSESCRAYPPGSEKAMSIKDVAKNKSYKLTKAEGVPIAPANGKATDFTLTFEPFRRTFLNSTFMRVL